MNLEKLIVIENDELIRVDKYLSQKLSYSREDIIKMIKSGSILINEKQVKPNYIVKLKDEILVGELICKETNLKDTNIPLDIIYEDEDIIIVNKQSGLTVHPGNGNKENTLVNALLYYNKNLSDIGGLERPGVVHRIDKDTSGLIILAKNNKTHEILSDYFKNKSIKRTYIALVKGVIENSSGTIDAPIGRDENNRLKMAVTSKNSKEAVTHFKVLKRYKRYTLLSLVLDTGRTHQIRVHMKYISHPIFNDPLYTNDKCTEFGQFLHSSEMEFIHPTTKEKMKFDCPLPFEFEDYLKNLD